MQLTATCGQACLYSTLPVPRELSLFVVVVNNLSPQNLRVQLLLLVQIQHALAEPAHVAHDQRLRLVVLDVWVLEQAERLLAVPVLLGEVVEGGPDVQIVLEQGVADGGAERAALGDEVLEELDELVRVVQEQVDVVLRVGPLGGVREGGVGRGRRFAASDETKICGIIDKIGPFF